MEMNINNLLKEIPSYTQAIKRLEEKAFIAHQKAFPPLKKALKGKKVALVATGPTLEFFNKIEDITYIGINKALFYQTINFNYIFSIDYIPGLNDYIDKYNKNTCKKYYGFHIQQPINISQKQIKSNLSYQFFVDIYSKNPKTGFTKDISTKIVSYGNTSAIITMVCLLWAEPEKIYLIGTDCSGTPSLKRDFYSSLILEWKSLSNFAKKYYPQVEIISINPRGLKGIFIDKYQNFSAIEALEYKEKGEMQKAADASEKALKQDPENTGLIKLLAGILRQKKDLKKCESIINNVLKEKPLWSEGYKELSLLASAQCQKKQEIKWGEKAVSCEPENPLIRAYLANIFYKHKDKNSFLKTIKDAKDNIFNKYIATQLGINAAFYEENLNLKKAIKLRNDDLQLNPYDELSRSYLNILLLFKTHDLNSLQKSAKLGLLLNNKWAYGYRSLAWKAQLIGKLDTALLYLKESIKIYPFSILFWTHFLEILRKKCSYGTAFKIIDQIIKIQPNCPNALYELSLLYEAVGDIEKAIIYSLHATKEVRIYETDVYRTKFRINASRLLSKKGNIVKAKSLLIEKIYYDHTWGEGLYQLSKLLDTFYLKNNELHTTEIKNKEKKHKWNSIHQILLLLQNKEYYKAETLAQNMITNQPDWGLAWLQLSRVYKCKGEMSLAQSAAYKAFERDPHNGIIEQNLKDLLLPSLNIIKSLYDSREFEKAIVEASKLIDNAPKFGEGYRLLALCYEALGKKEKAIEIEQTSIESALNDIRWNRVHLTALLLGQKRVCEAEREARNLLAASPEWGVSWRQLSYVYKAQQDFAHAFNAALKAFELDPNNKSIQDNLKALKDAYS